MKALPRTVDDAHPEEDTKEAEGPHVGERREAPHSTIPAPMVADILRATGIPADEVERYSVLRSISDDVPIPLLSNPVTAIGIDVRQRVIDEGEERRKYARWYPEYQEIDSDTYSVRTFQGLVIDAPEEDSTGGTDESPPGVAGDDGDEGMWLPQVSRDGQIFYFNMETGKTSLHPNGQSSKAAELSTQDSSVEGDDALPTPRPRGNNKPAPVNAVPTSGWAEPRSGIVRTHGVGFSSIRAAKSAYAHSRGGEQVDLCSAKNPASILRPLISPFLTSNLITDNPDQDFILRTAIYDDIPAICQIHLEAYIYDQLTKLAQRELGVTPEQSKARMIPRFQELWKKADGHGFWPVIAESRSDGAPLGCALWVFSDGRRRKGDGSVDDGDGKEVGGEGEEPEDSYHPSSREFASAAPEKTSSTAFDIMAALRMHPPASDESRSQRYANKMEEDPNKRKKSLNEVSHESLIAMHNRWIKPEERCMYLASLAVSATHQSHGVGGALLRAGMARADAESLAIWLEGTPAGHPVYEHMGWKTLEESGLDLADWTAKDSGYGKYGWWMCLRMPVLPTRR